MSVSRSFNILEQLSVKGINHHSINSWQYGTEQRKMSSFLCRIKKLSSSCWWYCSSAQLRMEHCCHLQKIYLVRSLTYISLRYFASGRSLVISSPSTYRDVQQKLISGIHKAFIWPVVVIVDGNITKPNKRDFKAGDDCYIILI